MTRMQLPLLVCLGSLLVALGCSGGNALAPARVSGSISYKGQSIKAGTLAFHTSEGTSYAGQISSDGTYTATDLPTGELVITVDTESVNPNRAGSGGKDAGRRMGVGQQQPPPGAGSAPPPSASYVKIPSKYNNPKTSPLTVTLAAGRKVHHIDLAD